MARASRPEARGVGRAGAPAQLIGAMLVIVIAVLVQVRSGLNHDVAWYLQVARSAAKGAAYYVDRPGAYLDINPPLVVWTLLPPLWLARRFGLPMTAAPALLVSMELVLSIALTRAILRRSNMGPALIWGLLVAGLVVVGSEFGQREHQVVILLYPALVALAVVPGAATLPRWLRVSVGLLAGLGLALKPHFVLAWALLELVSAAYDRRPWQLVRVEVLAAAGVVIAYVATVVAFTPGYLAVVREWAPLYLRWLRTPVGILVLQPECVLGVLALALAVRLRAAGRPGRTAFVFALAATAFAVVAVVQGKGFSYHWYPVVAFGAISIAASLRALDGGRTNSLTTVSATVIGVLILLVVWARVSNGFTIGADRRRLERAIAAAASSPDDSTGRGNELVILSTRVVDAFPMVTNLNLDWTQRWPSLWVIEAAAPVACVDALAGEDRDREQRVRDDLWEDLIRAQPRTIIVQPIPRSMRRRQGCSTLRDHLARDPRFASLFAEYVPTGAIANGVDAPFTVLRRRGALKDAAAPIGARR